MSRAVVIPLLIGLVSVASLALPLPGSSSEGMGLVDFVKLYLAGDKELEASSLRLAASATSARASAYLTYPTFSFDVGSPYYSWGRIYTYRDYLGQTYRGYLESEDRSYWLTLRMSQELPTGGDLTIEGSTRRDRTVFSYAGFPSEIPLERDRGDRQFMADVGVSLTQPVLGFWEKRDDARRASLRHEKARIAARRESAESVKRAVDLFFDCLVDARRAEVERRRADRASTEAARAQRHFEQGLVAEADLLGKQVEANNAGVAYFEAASALVRAQSGVAAVTERSLAEPLPADVGAILDFKRAGVDTSRARAGASPGVLDARLDEEIARIDLAEASRKRFGRTSVSLWYGLQGLGDDYSEAREGFGRNKWGGALSVGLSLPDAGVSSGVTAARAGLRVAEAALGEALRTEAEDLRVLTERMRVLEANMALQRRQAELLEELAATRKAQRAEGILSDSDLARAEDDALGARIDLLETMRAFGLNWVDLLLAAGYDPALIVGRLGD